MQNLTTNKLVFKYKHTMGETFFAFRKDSIGFVYKYDVQKENWFKISCEMKNIVYNFSCSKLLKVN